MALRNAKGHIVVGEIDLPGMGIDGCPVKYLGVQNGYPWVRALKDWPATIYDLPGVMGGEDELASVRAGDEFVWSPERIR